MKKSLIIFFVLTIGSTVFAQQEMQFSHNVFNQFGVNPGAAGRKNAICFTSLLRRQWAGAFTHEDGSNASPEQILIYGSMPIPKIHGAIGLTIMQDKLAFESNVGLKLAYAYKTMISNGNFGGGIQFGLLNKSIETSGLKATKDNDPLISALNSGESKDMIFDIGLGLFYEIPEKLFFGFSTNQMLKSEGSKTYVKLTQHWYVSGGYYYTLPSMPNLTLIPSILVKKERATTQYDISCIGMFQKRFWGGLGYRITDGIQMSIGFKPFKNGTMETLRVGYSYDITTSKIGSGGHEVFIGYCFNLDIKQSDIRYKNVRFL